MSESPSERVIEYDDSTKVSCLTDSLKLHFKAKQAPGSKNSLGKYMNQLKSKIKESNPKIQTDDIVRQLASIQLVDIVPLLQQKKENKWECVSMYVDDNGLNKGIPLNRRAMELCSLCGMPPREIAGDVFLARAIDDNADLYKRLDFEMTDLNSSARWIEMARSIHCKSKALQKRSENVLKQARDLKSQGNVAFGKSQFDKAFEKYKEAIETLNVTDPRHEESDFCQVLWMNLAAVELKKNRYENAVAASTNALKFGPKAKAYYRRACAYESLKQYSKSCLDLKEGLKLNPKDKTLKSKLDQVTSIMILTKKT